jgi:hypothetical protein
MKNVFVLLMVIVLITSCKITKTSKVEKQTYSWEGKKVTKKVYDKLLYDYTVKFVNDYQKKDDLKTFTNLEVIYDTTTKK